MQDSRLRRIPGRLWRLIALAHHRLLMIDYDGTLAPFQEDRDRARPASRTLDRLRRIADSPHTTVVVASGRPVEELASLVLPVTATLVGEHGWETLSSNGTLSRPPVPPSASLALQRAAKAALKSGWGAFLERKRSAVRLHTRGLADTEAFLVEAECAALWQPEAADGVVRLDRVDGGLELRARGRDKGTAALELVAGCPPGTMAVVVGDDATDEDAFEVVREFGFGVRVGDVGEPSLAHGRLGSIEEVPEFFEAWLRAVEENETTGDLIEWGPPLSA